MEQWQAVRIALVVTGGVDRSGREKVVPALLWFIERIARGNDVAVYVLRYHEEPRSYPLLGATVHDLGRPSGILRQYSRLVDRVRRDGPFNVIHAYWALPAGLAAVLAGRRLGIPTIVTLDSGELIAIPDIAYGLQRKWRQRAAVRMTLAWADRITVCTHYMQRLAHRHGVDATVMPFGVDTTIFNAPRRPLSPSTIARGSLSEVEGSERSESKGHAPSGRSESKGLLNVAHLNPVKDQRTLVEAFRRVIDRVPGVHLDIAGEDTMNGAIQRHARQLGISDHVTFHGALVSEDVATLYRNAELFVLSSRHEAASVAALEAAASGVPIVGTRVGYVADWAPDRAVAVPPADPSALAEAIIATLGDAAQRERLARSAREWVLAHDADWTARQFLNLYRSM